MGRASADSSAPSSRTPLPPPCSASCRSWIARAILASSHLGSTRSAWVIAAESSLGEHAKDVAILAHDLLRNLHLRREVRVGSGEPNPIRGFGCIERVAWADPQTGEQ